MNFLSFRSSKVTNPGIGRHEIGILNFDWWSEIFDVKGHITSILYTIFESQFCACTFVQKNVEHKWFMFISENKYL